MRDYTEAPEATTDQPDLLPAVVRNRLDEVANNVAFARVRCRTTADLINCSCNFLDSNRVMAQKALKERKLTEHEQFTLESRMRQSLTDQYRNDLPTRFRQGTDRLGSNLGELLPAARARLLAAELLAHPIQARRLAGIKLIRRIGCMAEDANALRAAFMAHGDYDALELLTRIPNSLPDLTCCEFLVRISYPTKFDSEYLAALVIARLWADNRLDHEHSADSHDLAYVRAMGRVNDRSREELLCMTVSKSSDPEVLSMAASVAGRLQLSSVIDRIEQRSTTLLEALPLEDEVL